MAIAFIKTPIGTAKVIGDKKGITEINILDSESESNIIPEELEFAVNQIQEYFEGKRTMFTFEINPKGTDFQKKVWKALLRIPFGKTISYLTLSKEIGTVKAIRAVASANGKNPIWIVIPCHRVVGSDGTLTGYAGGLWRKKWLLEHENPIRQESLF
jgi:methylated-DNA-[protein]-cysteine S-methyltransferase